MSDKNNNGDSSTPTNIQIDFVGSGRLDDMKTTDKIRLIIDSVKDNKVVVLEDGLTPDEEGRLVEMTMQQIGPEQDFSGLEIERYNRGQESSGFISRLVSNNKKKSKLTIIGPANRLQTVENEDMMQAIISG